MCPDTPYDISFNYNVISGAGAGICLLFVYTATGGGVSGSNIFAAPGSGTAYLTRKITNVHELDFYTEVAGYGSCLGSKISNLTLIANPY